MKTIDEIPYCHNCGEDKNLKYLEQYANGEYYECGECGEKFFFNPPKDDEGAYVVAESTHVIDTIKKIPQQPQVQYDLHRQIKELREAANKLGLYDAADFLKNKI